MKEENAMAVADALGGETWQSGGGIWLVLKRTANGRVISFSDEVVIEYESEKAFENDQQKASIVIV